MGRFSVIFYAMRFIDERVGRIPVGYTDLDIDWRGTCRVTVVLD